MNVLVSNVTPFVVWRAMGGLVGACRSLDEARGLVADLKESFPHNDYICKDIDGNVVIDTGGSDDPV